MTATLRKYPANTPWCDGAYHNDPDEDFCDHNAGMVSLTMGHVGTFISLNTTGFDVDRITVDEMRELARQLLALAGLHHQRRV